MKMKEWKVRVPFKGRINFFNGTINFIKTYKESLKVIFLGLFLITIMFVGTKFYKSMQNYKKIITNLETNISAIQIENKILIDNLEEYNIIFKNNDIKNQKNQNDIINYKKEAEELKKSLKKNNNNITTSTNVTKASIKAVSGIAYSPNETQVIIWNTLRSYGWSKEVCAGIMGNIQQECDFDPYSGNKSSGYGICQWVGGRYTILVENYDTSLEGQLRYLYDSMQDSRYIGILSLTSVDEVTTQFCTKYERAGQPNMLKRLQYAANAYKTFA